MIIPKTITVGPMQFNVLHVKALDNPPAYGRIDFVAGTIKIASHSIYEVRYSADDRRRAFWHETIHACLVDMGQPLHKHDERFVEELAKRLTQVCCTAEV
jgi:hypothetical protein